MLNSLFFQLAIVQPDFNSYFNNQKNKISYSHQRIHQGFLCGREDVRSELWVHLDQPIYIHPNIMNA